MNSGPEETSELPADLARYLNARDGAKDLSSILPKRFTPAQVAEPSNEQRIWERLGLFYFNQQPKRRNFEALGIFFALYRHMLTAQTESGVHVHKGMPLLWIAECFGDAGFAVLRKRYLMLALCEDAKRGAGLIDVDSSGVYFRLVWRLGMNDAMLRRYAIEAHGFFGKDPRRAQFPEWILQHLDQDWMTEFPSPAEANLYVLSPQYAASMMAELGESQGKALELLAEYIMLCMPGCRTSRRKRSKSTDYDLICSMEGIDVDFLGTLAWRKL